MQAQYQDNGCYRINATTGLGYHHKIFFLNWNQILFNNVSSKDTGWSKISTAFLRSSKHIQWWYAPYPGCWTMKPKYVTNSIKNQSVLSVYLCVIWKMWAWLYVLPHMSSPKIPNWCQLNLTFGGWD